MRTCLLLQIVFLSVILLGFADAQDHSQIQVTFQMHSPVLSEQSRVFIAGNVAALGNWRPDVAQMKFTGQQTWSFELSVPRGKAIEYKYTLGDWAREGARTNGEPLANFKLTPTESITQTDRIEAWTDRKPRALKGQVTGELRYHRKIEAEGLRPRDIVVWLPPSYESDANRTYPVLYMHDGQNLVDPRTSAFGVDWQVDETITKLMETEQIPPIIVVGIFNTRDRSREYGEGEKGIRYRNFIVNKLKPFIDAEYRTKPDREQTLVGGSSAGGLCAFIMAWEHAETFSAALCMSPAFRFERPDGTVAIDYVRRVVASPRPQPSIRLYIDNGGRGVDVRLMPGVEAMVKELDAKGFVEGADLRVVIAPEDPHNESAWARRFPAAIQWLLDGTKNLNSD